MNSIHSSDDLTHTFDSLALSVLLLAVLDGQSLASWPTPLHLKHSQVEPQKVFPPLCMTMYCDHTLRIWGTGYSFLWLEAKWILQKLSLNTRRKKPIHNYELKDTKQHYQIINIDLWEPYFGYEPLDDVNRHWWIVLSLINHTNCHTCVRCLQTQPDSVDCSLSEL